MHELVGGHANKYGATCERARCVRDVSWVGILELQRGRPGAREYRSTM